MKKVLLLILAIGVIFLMACSGDSDTAENTNEQGNKEEDKKELTYGDTFVFDDFEVTFNENYEIIVVDNEISSYNGMAAIKFPIHVKNIKNDTYGLNSLYFKFYNPTGTQSDIVTYIWDDDVFQMGDMRSGAEQDTYFCIVYEGDGDYYMEVGMFSNAMTEVKLSVKK